MESKGRTLIVGVKLNTGCRDILTWALHKEAREGDRLIALHVVLGGPFKDHKKSCNDDVHRILHSYLRACYGLCKTKQVDLEIRICYGQLRKVLLEETRLCKATELILGTSKQDAVVSPISLAKYCIQRLPSTAKVLVVNKGKVAFINYGTICKQESKSPLSPARNSVSDCKPLVTSKPIRRSVSAKAYPPKFDEEEVEDNMACTKTPEYAKDAGSLTKPKKRRSKTNISGSQFLRSYFGPMPLLSIKSRHKKQVLAEVLKYNETRERTDNQQCNNRSNKDGHRIIFTTDNSELDLMSLTPSPVEELEKSSEEIYNEIEYKSMKLDSDKVDNPTTATSEKPVRNESVKGWPLMHRAISSDNFSIENQTKGREISVVEWVFQLPDRKGSTKNKATFEEVKLEDHEAKLDGEARENPSLNLIPEFQKPAEEHRSESLSDEDCMVRIKSETEETDNPLMRKLHRLCQGTECRQFSYEVLEEATSKFSDDNLIGRGGCSRVYKGILSDGKLVAVKVLSSSPMVEEEMISEVEIVTSVKHKNIISMVGYCISSKERLLVYDFVSKGNLEENLHAKKDKPVIPWKARFRIATGIAEALEYLHAGSSRFVIHRDVKSSNILLSQDFEPLITDFGLAKWAETASSHIICDDVAGTFGYLAPEYFMHGKINEKTDVYSYGVVLLELITGKQPIDPAIVSNNSESLVAWARPFMEGGQIKDLIDPKLEDAYEEIEMQRMVLAASMCTRRSSRLRPRMTRILNVLRGEDDTLNCVPNSLSLPNSFVKDEGQDGEEEEELKSRDMTCYLSLALLGVDDSAESFDSSDHSGQIKSWKEYLRGRFSRTPSFE